MRTLLPLLFALTACLENEEEITVHPDGSLTVRIAAEGDAGDLAQGYPLPTSAAFAPRGDATASWLANVGPLSGGNAARERLRAGAWTDAAGVPFEKGRLEVEGRFASVQDLPTVFAPETEPYATAFLERHTSLDVQVKGGRTVFVFERVYAQRSELGTFLEGLNALKERVPESVMERIEDEMEGVPSLPSMTDRDWDVVTRQIQVLFRQSCERILDETILALYTLGDASLSVQASRRLREAVVESTVVVVTSDYLREVAERARAWKVADGRGEPVGPHPIEDIETDLRQSLRDGLRAALEAESLDPNVQNAVLRTLEWNFASLDQRSDLDDEKFELDVHMPGTIVGGNFDASDANHAHFEFEGEDLRERDVRLRVVSVLE